MDEIYIPVIAILSSVALPIAVGLILGYQKITSQHKERMGLINQGIIPPMDEPRKKIPNRYNSLRNGVILISLGIGIIVGLICANNLALAEDNEFWIIASTIVFFLGLGYLSFFALSKNMPGENNESNDQQPE